jgi:hypothetical protein
MTGMNRDQVAAFIAAINAAQPYVPPLIFAAIVNNPTSNCLAAIANGLVEYQPKPSATPPAHEAVSNAAR